MEMAAAVFGLPWFMCKLLSAAWLLRVVPTFRR